MGLNMNYKELKKYLEEIDSSLKFVPIKNKQTKADIADLIDRT